MSLLLGIDSGTSSTKGVLVRPDGSIVARAQVGHGVSSPHPGRFEHDPEGVWWSDFSAVVGRLTADADAPIASLAVSGIGPCLLPADEGGPLRPRDPLRHRQPGHGRDRRAGREPRRRDDHRPLRLAAATQAVQGAPERPRCVAGAAPPP